MIVQQITTKNDEYYTPEYAITPLLKYVGGGYNMVSI